MASWRKEGGGLQALPPRPWPPTTPLDFDDLLLLPVQLWQSKRQVRHYGTGRFRHVLVDVVPETPTHPVRPDSSCWSGRPATRAVRRLGPALGVRRQASDQEI